MKSLRDEIRLRRVKRTDLISSRAKRTISTGLCPDFTAPQARFHFLCFCSFRTQIITQILKTYFLSRFVYSSVNHRKSPCFCKCFFQRNLPFRQMKSASSAGVGGTRSGGSHLTAYAALPFRQPFLYGRARRHSFAVSANCILTGL